MLQGGRVKALSPRVLAVCAALLLSACGGQVERPAVVSRPAPVARPVPATPIPSVPSLAVQTGGNAAGTGFVLGPPVANLPLREEDAVRAVAAFRMSCASLQRRTDTSGLTRGTDWQAACSAAPAVAPGAARAFFAQYFEAVQIADGKAFATGYYEPEIAASRQPMAGYAVPIYGRPGDLIDVDLSLFSESLKGRKIRGRVSAPTSFPTTIAPRSSRARSTVARRSSLMRPILWRCSSCKCRGRAGCGCPTGRSFGSATPRRTVAITPGLAR